MKHLAGVIKDKDVTRAKAALSILQELFSECPQKERPDIVSAIAGMLKTCPHALKGPAIAALGAVGAEAKSAIPAIEPYLKDTSIMNGAIKAIRAIDPDYRGSVGPEMEDLGIDLEGLD